MPHPHFQRRMLSIAVLLVSAVAIAEPFISCTLAQESETTKSTLTEQGLAFYKAGDNKRAAQALRNATKQSGDDATAWHYLGLALLRRGERKDAGKAFKTAAHLRLAQISSVLTAYGSSRRGQLTSLCEEAKRSVEEYLTLVPFSFQEYESIEWRKIMSSLQSLELLLSDESREVFPQNAVTTRIRVLEKPEPSYTASAKNAGLVGTIVLVAVFDHNGSVATILPVRTLGHGLMLQAIEAAQKIRFVPATKDGRRVSTAILLHYSFSFF